MYMYTYVLYVRSNYANDSLFRILVNVANYFPSTSQIQFHEERPPACATFTTGTCCLINCAMPNLLRELTIIVYGEKSARATVVQKFNHRKTRSRKLIYRCTLSSSLCCTRILKYISIFRTFHLYFIKCRFFFILLIRYSLFAGAKIYSERN